MIWIEKEPDLFDVVVVDFPDPNSYAVGKLYTSRFYSLVKKKLDPEGVVAVQSTSPLFARRSFWIVDATLRAAGFSTRPYHIAVPSFGDWGFVLASANAGERVAAPARGPPRAVDGRSSRRSSSSAPTWRASTTSP